MEVEVLRDIPVQGLGPIQVDLGNPWAHQNVGQKLLQNLGSPLPLEGGTLSNSVEGEGGLLRCWKVLEESVLVVSAVHLNP